MPGCISLNSIRRSRSSVSLTYSLDSQQFETTYRYDPSINLIELEDRFGRGPMTRIYFHMLALEAAKLVSLAPESIDVGPFAEFDTRQFREFWQTLVRRIWSQWRYTHRRPDYLGPSFRTRGRTGGGTPVRFDATSSCVLNMCGGGKDSLVTMKLFEESGIPFCSYAYSHSVYGEAEFQHSLIDRLLDEGQPRKRHKHWVHDSLLRKHGNSEFKSPEIIAAETPCAVIGALPVMLHEGYEFLTVGHERSANKGNVIWNETGEDVNHQWGKSFAAETVLNEYITSELVAGVRYFSLLQQIHDVTIFNALRDHPGALEHTHSCNVSKPWCKRCPKCAYVWLNYMAYLSIDQVASMFEENLFDMECNQEWFAGMLGLREHTPFECIGQVPEAKLAFEMCKAKGVRGRAMDLYVDEVGKVSVQSIVAEYTNIGSDLHQVPHSIEARIRPLLRRYSRQAKQHICNHLLPEFATV